MDLKAIVNFRVIGSCAKMQTIHWAEEIKLIDGIFYDISFDQDFTNIHLNEQEIDTMSVVSIIDFIKKIETNGVESDFAYSELVFPTLASIGKNYFSLSDWKLADKIVKKDYETEEQWKRDCASKKSNKRKNKAQKKFANIRLF